MAGRAGRGDVEGEVLVQAFTPFHPAIQYARRHDFNGFYDQEMEFRRQLQLSARQPHRPAAAPGPQRGKSRILRRSRESANWQKKPPAISDLVIKGPAAAPMARAKTEYRWQIMLFTRQMSRLSLALADLQAALTLPDEVRMTVDIDPVDLM